MLRMVLTTVEIQAGGVAPGLVFNRRQQLDSIASEAAQWPASGWVDSPFVKRFDVLTRMNTGGNPVRRC